jgi:hypothetical protein
MPRFGVALQDGLSVNPRVHRLFILIFGFIALNLMLSVLFFSALITSRILLYLLAPPVTALLTLVSALPFGWELAIRNILLGVSAESTQKGTWLIELVEPNAPKPGSEVPLSHSEIYDNEMAIRKLISWIRERSLGAVVA